MKKIILASASPRRKEIMEKNGLAPLIIPAHVNEELPFPMTPEASVMYLSLKKAYHVAFTMNENVSADARDAGEQDCSEEVIIGSDTIVVHDGHIIGKPKAPREAFSVLSALRGTEHHVITGVCVIELSEGKRPAVTCLYDTSSVFFKDYGDDELTEYVNTPEPYDKAGGYAIQGTFGRYVERVEGDIDNVIGFPFYKVKRFLY